MLGDVFQADTDRALDDLAAKAPDKPKPVAKWSGWSAPLRGIAAGASEAAAFAADSVKGYGEVMGATGTQSAGGMFSLQSEKERRDTELQRIKNEQAIDTTSEIGTSLRNVAHDYRPDPATAGLAERLAFDLPRFLGKAVGYTVAGGGVPGAVALGADEAMVTADDLGRQGVDQSTRMKAGALAGVAAAAGVLLPVAAPGSIAKTVGLWAAGGPGAFIAQQAATREILAHANYGELAQQYDPLDPVGLAVSSLVPAGFAAWAVRGARVKPVASTAPAGGDVKVSAVEPPTKIEPTLNPEQVDAVMTHNLTLARDVHEASAPPDALAARAADAQRIRDVLPTETVAPRPVVEIDAFAARMAQSEDVSVRNVGEGIAKAADSMAPDQLAAITRAADAYVQARASGEPIAKALDAMDLAPEIKRLVTGIVDNAQSPARIESMAREVMTMAQDASASAKSADTAAPALTADHLTNTPGAPAKPQTDPLLASIQERVARVEQMAPDMVIRTDDAGKPVTVANEMARIREESKVGTDTELGADDADLVRVAANCTLSTGS